MKKFSAIILAVTSVLFINACSPALESNADNPANGDIHHSQPTMTPKLLREIITQIDSDARISANTMAFAAAEQEVAVVYDTEADRMRIMIPVVPTKELDPKEYERLLQANFDSALDARYAIAQDTLWATYIHPLSTLSENEFLLGLAQTVNIAKNFGDSYSSGMFTFGAGDSITLERKKLLELLQQETT